MIERDTIAAIATGMTDAGIGIIRISGDQALKIAGKLFRPKQKKKTIENLESYQAAYGAIYDGEEMIDECIALVMKGPATYTAEHVVELDCHGGIVICKRVLELVLSHGARLAEPGEFTKRAFLNGRIDLSQAESVMDLIHSKNEFARKSSLSQVRGSLSNKIAAMRESILYEMAYIESALDDPEHYSLDSYSERLEETIGKIAEQLEILIRNSENGKLLKDGIRTVIIGKPNAGKSSLLNVLVGEERAIVTEIEGTTRDTLQEYITIQGIPLHMIDTAGIRDTKDMVEQIGVKKSLECIEEADLVLYVVDSSRPLDKNDETIMNHIKEKNVIVLMNKSDLEVKVEKELITSRFSCPIVDISAKEETGFEEFYQIINEMFFHGELTSQQEIYITNMRQKQLLEHALESIHKVVDSIEQNMPEDFFSIDLMDAYESLGLIIGESVEDDLVDKIFREFCMGK